MYFKLIKSSKKVRALIFYHKTTSTISDICGDRMYRNHWYSLLRGTNIYKTVITDQMYLRKRSHIWPRQLFVETLINAELEIDEHRELLIILRFPRVKRLSELEIVHVHTILFSRGVS